MKNFKFKGVSRGIRYPKGKVYTGFYDGGWSIDAPCIFFEDKRGWNFVPVEPDSVVPAFEDIDTDNDNTAS